MGPSSISRFPAAGPAANDTIVLLVDDDESFRNALAEHLREDGYRVVEYATAREIPPLTAFGEVEALVTDYDMPGTNGLTFADTFHAVYPNAPIIMVTGACTKNLEAQAAARSFLSLLRKPIEYDKLHHLLHQTATLGS